MWPLFKFRSEEKEIESKERLQVLLKGRESYAKHGLTVHTYADGFDFDDEVCRKPLFCLFPFI